jgi:CHAT domain-containing protein
MAIVHYSLTERRAVALVISEEGINHVPLPDLDARRAFELVRKWYEAYFRTCRRGDRLDGPAWSRSMADILETIGHQAIRPVVKELKGIQRLILVPNRALHVFPLHACLLNDGRLVGDAFEVTYTPSLSILHRCAVRSRPRPDRLLTVENPTGDLGYTECESALIRAYFATQERRWLADAQREWLLDHSSRFQSWHYAGHSWFNLGDPLASGLVLEDKGRRDRWLTLRDIFTRMKLPEATLAVLSGCESGSVLPDEIDEYVGLPSGFLFAGATCVVASLWAVPDLATAVLMGRFYANWRERGMHIGAALRDAQRWLREEIKTGLQLRDEIVTEEFLNHVTDPRRRDSCRRQRDVKVRDYPDSPPFGGLAEWAAFTAIGLTYPPPGRPNTNQASHT